VHTGYRGRLKAKFRVLTTYAPGKKTRNVNDRNGPPKRHTKTRQEDQEKAWDETGDGEAGRGYEGREGKTEGEIEGLAL